MKSQSLSVKKDGADAIVKTDVNTFSVTTAVVKNRKNCSPVELLMSSLGS
jgi:hypothetical protein